MKAVYHYLGVVTFWLLVSVCLYSLWDLWLKNSRVGDWIFAVKTWLFIWFRKDTELIERELHFINTAYSDKAKKRWEHIVIVSAYKIKIKSLTIKI